MPENILDNNFNKPITEMYGINKYGYFSQFLAWLGVFSACFLIAQLLSGLFMVICYGSNISDLTNIVKGNGNLNGLRFAQMIATVFGFLVPALIF
ncbi:MAG: hypothetical protein IPF58_11995 [Saprospirales bacterium]|nr:hypothetical protein [Saprospirales bacterium]